MLTLRHYFTVKLLIMYMWDTVGLYAVTITVNTYEIFINVSSHMQCVMQVVNGQNTMCWPGLTARALLGTRART